MTVSITVTHAPGEGSYRLYKSGCRCDECREANTVLMRDCRARRRERKRQDEIRAAARIVQEGIWNGQDALTIATNLRGAG